MKAKAISGIILTALLIITGFHVIPVLSQPTIKIGAIGPMGWPPGDGMWDGARLARDEINAMGGVDVGGVMHQIELVSGNEIIYPSPEPDAAAIEMERLIADEEVDFVIGGFRSENVFAMREVAMDYQKIFIITGAATDELVDCGTGTCGSCVRCDYARYKYVFRATPPNETTLAKSLAAFLGYYVIPERLLPLYGEYLWPGAPNPQVKVAVIAEDLVWTDTIFYCLTNPAVYPYVLGPYANVTYSALVPPNTNAAGFIPHLTSIIANEARLIVHLFSGQAGVDFIWQWGNMEVEAIPVGINVFSQLSAMWGLTAGKCEYETFIAASGTGTPIVPGITGGFWTNFVGNYSVWPLYTAFGAYDAIYTLKEAIEIVGTIDSDAVVAGLEQTDRISTLGRFKFTEGHDVFVNEIGPAWIEGFVRPLIVQWQAGKLEVVWPQDQSYSRRWQIPSQMYWLDGVDINLDLCVNMIDLVMAGISFGSGPEASPPDMSARWNLECDVVTDGVIDLFDVISIAVRYGEGEWAPPPPLGPAHLDVRPSRTVIGVNTTFTVDIDLVDVENLYGYEFELNFNTTLLDLISVNNTPPEPWFSNWYKVEIGKVEWWIITALWPALTFSGNATLATLEFNCSIKGHATLNLTDCLFVADLGDWCLEAIPLITVNATVQITTPGDVNADNIVDIYDAIRLAGAFGSEPVDPNWNPNADINGDNIVDIYDAIILANHFGEEG